MLTATNTQQLPHYRAGQAAEDGYRRKMATYTREFIIDNNCGVDLVLFVLETSGTMHPEARTCLRRLSDYAKYPDIEYAQIIKNISVHVQAARAKQISDAIKRYSTDSKLTEPWISPGPGVVAPLQRPRRITALGIANRGRGRALSALLPQTIEGSTIIDNGVVVGISSGGSGEIDGIVRNGSSGSSSSSSSSIVNGRSETAIVVVDEVTALARLVVETVAATAGAATTMVGNRVPTMVVIGEGVGDNHGGIGGGVNRSGDGSSGGGGSRGGRGNVGGNWRDDGSGGRHDGDSGGGRGRGGGGSSSDSRLIYGTDAEE
jgi:hypothetical protein